MASVVGELLISMGLESGQFKSGMDTVQKQLKTAERQFQKIGKTFQSVGTKLTIGLTAPIVAFGVQAVKAAAESRDAMAQVEATLTSMGTAAGRTSEQLAKAGKELQYMSTFDDDEILRSVTANMLTFGNIAEDQFDRAQRAAVNLSVKLDQDLKSSTIQIGKALNDPVKGLAALGRVGIQFTKQQSDQIKAMVKVGQVAKAQSKILDELEKQYDGSAKAARDAVPGSDAINKWNDLKESIGEQLLQAFERIEPAINRVLGLFNELSPSMQSNIVVAGGLAAALGPLLYIFGSLTKVMAPFLATMSVVKTIALQTAGAAGLGFLSTTLVVLQGLFAALTTILAPFLIPLAALALLGAVIYANWEKIRPVLEEFADSFKKALGPKVEKLINKLSISLTELWDGPLGDAVRFVIDLLGELLVVFLKIFGAVVIKALGVFLDVFGLVFDTISSVIKIIIALLTGDFKGAWEEVKNHFGNVADFIFNVLSSLSGESVENIKKMVLGIKDWILGKLNKIWDAVGNKVEDVKGYFYSLYDAVVGNSYIPDMVDEIGQHMQKLDNNMVKPAKKATKAVKEAFEKLRDQVDAILNRLFPEIRALVDFRDDQKALEAYFKAGRLGAEQFARALSRLSAEKVRGSFGETPLALDDPNFQGLPAPEKLIALPDKEIAKITGGLTKIRKGWAETTLDIIENSGKTAEAIGDMTARIEGSLRDFVSSIKRGDIIGIIIGLADTVAAISSAITGIRSFGKPAKPIPQFASGTSFAPGGLSLVGERGPELVNLPRGSQVIPNHQLGQDASPMRIIINPSPYFDAVVDQRARGVASPLAARGALAGADLAQTRMQRSRRNYIP